jgi:long-chain acyl-CoA synthetase
MATLIDLIDEAVEKYSDRIAVRSILTGEEYTFDQVRQNAWKVSASLTESGITKGDRVAIFTDNDPNFLFADYGTLYTGAATVGIPQEARPESMIAEYLEKTEPKVIITQRKHLDRITGQNIKGIPIICIEEALEHEPVRPDMQLSESDPAVMLPSSGTSAESDHDFKYAVHTHGSLASNISVTEPMIGLVAGGTYMTGIAGQSHIFEYFVQKAVFSKGTCLHYTNKSGLISKGHGSMINPDLIIMIPEAANNIMHRVMDQIAGKKKIRKEDDKKKTAQRSSRTGILKSTRSFLSSKVSRYLISPLFRLAIRNSGKYYYGLLNQGKESRIREYFHKRSDSIFYSRIRDVLSRTFGKGKRMLVGGSAPLGLETQLFFYSIGIPIYQGYGVTEASVISVNRPGEYRMRSSGKVLEGLELMIIDLETHKPLAPDKDGLIVVGGSINMQGYFREPELTKKAFITLEDGTRWYDTGDIGCLDEDGFLYINGRNRRLIVLPSGNKVYPERIEAHYHGGLIDRLICIGGDNRPYVTALVVPDESLRYEISSGRITKEKARELISDQLSDSQQRFGVNLGNPRNLGLVMEFDERRYVNLNRKLKFCQFIRDHKALIDSLYHKN